MTVAELCKSIFVSDFTDIKLVRVTGMLENLNICFSSKIRRGSDFLLYGNKNVPSAEILRGRRCQRTRTFVLFGLNM
jgi:hypothetical protein